MATHRKRFVILGALLSLTSACALSLRNPDIADLQRHAGRYQDRTVSVSGVVTSSWGLPLLPFSNADVVQRHWSGLPGKRAHKKMLLFPFASLHALDGAGCDVIIVERLPETNAWLAVRDRLARAAH